MTLFWKVQNVLILQEAYNCVHSVELIHIYIKAFVYFCWKVFLWSESDFFKILVVQCCILFLWQFFHKRLCFCKDIFIKIRKVCNVKLENEQKKKTTVKYLIRQSTWKNMFYVLLVQSSSNNTWSDWHLPKDNFRLSPLLAL